MTAIGNLASTFRDQRKTKEAARLEEEMLEKSMRILGDHHPHVLKTMNNLALTYQEQGKT